MSKIINTGIPSLHLSFHNREVNANIKRGYSWGYSERYPKRFHIADGREYLIISQNSHDVKRKLTTVKYIHISSALTIWTNPSHWAILPLQQLYMSLITSLRLGS